MNKAEGENFKIWIRCNVFVAVDMSVVMTIVKSQCFAKMQRESDDSATPTIFEVNESD